MGRPVMGRGYFSGAFKFDAIDNGFEKIVLQVCLTDGTDEKGFVLKQTGYNKYLVVNTAGNRGIVRLVDKSADDYALVAGTAYLEVKDYETSTKHYVMKMMRNVIHTFDGHVYSYDYEISEDGLEGKFVTTNVDCIIDSAYITTSNNEKVVEANKELSKKDAKEEAKATARAAKLAEKKAAEAVEETPAPASENASEE